MAADSVDEATALMQPHSGLSHFDAASGIELDPGTGIEIVLVRERPRAHAETWRAFEIWTKNRIYGLDMAMKCFIVLDRKSGSVERGSPAKGYRLGGGRLKTEAGTRVSYPFPMVGTEAMLTDGKKRVHTSRVERFLIRIRELHLRTEEEALRWEDVESR